MVWDTLFVVLDTFGHDRFAVVVVVVVVVVVKHITNINATAAIWDTSIPKVSKFQTFWICGHFLYGG